jgi:hypothetical protein
LEGVVAMLVGELGWCRLCCLVRRIVEG